jgi:DnaJ-class molecular chaperone
MHADTPPDPYSVLGGDASLTGAQIKKKFWRVSLLIHPDKCSHKEAGNAFDAVKKAAQVLQDLTQRAELDSSRDQAEDAALNAAVMAELEKERKWRVLQGKATAEDLKWAVTARLLFCCDLIDTSTDAVFPHWTHLC